MRTARTYPATQRCDACHNHTRQRIVTVRSMKQKLAELHAEAGGASRCGQHAAIAAVYRSLAPAVTGYLRGCGVADPENVAGDVFVGVIRGLPNFTGDVSALRSWAFKIAYRRVLDDRRRRRRRPEDPLGTNVVMFAD